MLFSVVNVQSHAVELMPPQVQLGGKVKKGAIVHHVVWSNSEQLPVEDFRMSQRRIGPGERADGVLIFQRPELQAVQRNPVASDGRFRSGRPAGPGADRFRNQQSSRERSRIE